MFVIVQRYLARQGLTLRSPTFYTDKYHKSFKQIFFVRNFAYDEESPEIIM